MPERELFGTVFRQTTGINTKVGQRPDTLPVSNDKKGEKPLGFQYINIFICISATNAATIFYSAVALAQSGAADSQPVFLWLG